MRSDRILLLLMAGLLFTLQSAAQQTRRVVRNDTVFVYETRVIYDTVRIHDTLRIPARQQAESNFMKGIPVTILLRDPVSPDARVIIFSGTGAATLPLQRIIQDENQQNPVPMKKISFLGVMFLALNSMVMSQSQAGLTGGAGMWWASQNATFGADGLAPAFHLGVFAEIPLVKKWHFRPEACFYYMGNNYAYKQSLDPASDQTIGEEESASDWFKAVAALKTGYSFGRFKPSLGIEYAYRFSESWLDEQVNCFGLTAGIGVSVSPAVTVSLDYYLGLTKDFSFSGDIIDVMTHETIGTYDTYWKSSSLELTVSWGIPLKKKKEEKAKEEKETPR